MTPLDIASAERFRVVDRLETLAEALSDSGLQRTTRDRYRAEADLLAERLTRLDNPRYCASCENVEVECEGDRCDDCHARQAELDDEHATEGL